MKRLLLTMGLILAAAATRLLPHPPNVTPLAAMALAGGIYLDKRFSLIVPIAAMFLSDIILGFHQTMPFVYGSFLLTGLVGWMVRRHRSVSWIAGAAIASSTLFFVVTNFGVWILDSGAFYPKSLGGLTACYVAAIPFFRNTLLGDLFYTAVVCGAFELADRLLPAASASHVSNN